MKAIFKILALLVFAATFYLVCKGGNGFDALIMVASLSYWMVK